MQPSEPDRDSVERRLEAVERALADDEPLERVDRLDDLEGRVAELEAAVQALRGYVGSVRAVNEDVEHRAELALRRAAALERQLSGAESGPDGSDADSAGPPDEPDPTTHRDAGLLARLRRGL